MAGEPSRTPKDLVTWQLHVSPQEAQPVAVTLPPVSDAELATLRASNKRMVGVLKAQPEGRRVNIGVERPGAAILTPEAGALRWLRVDGGRVAQVSITSPDAEALRVAYDLANVPTTVELRFSGSANGRVETPVRVGDIVDRTQPWWSPVTEGATQVAEFFVPDGSMLAAPRAVRVSHLFTTPSSAFAKRVQDIGSSGACNVDILCSPLASDSAFANVVESVAQLVFQDGNLTGLCTGSLLNDSVTATQVPYFYSANHCFENDVAPFKTPAQMQTVANSVSTIWGFQATTCGSLTPRANWTQVGGGSTYLYNNAKSDALFIRLNNAPPSYAFYSGWDAASLAVGASLVGIHHPNGDLKKVSQGTMQGFVTLSEPGPGGGSFINVLWSSGTTEAGSSGSGLWTASSVNGGTQFLFHGALWGGSAACDNRSGTDNFSRFDQVYPSLSAYLGTGAAAPGPTFDFTDLWWSGPSQDGWGLNLVQHPSKILFGVWYTYDTSGNRTWFNFSDGSWTQTNVYTGTLYSVTGPPQSGTFDPSLVRRTPVGSVTLTFTDANNATFNWTVNGASGTKTIARFVF